MRKEEGGRERKGETEKVFEKTERERERERETKRGRERV